MPWFLYLICQSTEPGRVEQAIIEQTNRLIARFEAVRRFIIVAAADPILCSLDTLRKNMTL